MKLAGFQAILPFVPQMPVLFRIFQNRRGAGRIFLRVEGRRKKCASRANGGAGSGRTWRSDGHDFGRDFHMSPLPLYHFF